WKEIVVKSREINDVLMDIADEEKLEPWNYWRPREKENLEEEVREKTVDEAKLKEGHLEREGKSVVEESKEAVNEASKAITDIKNGDGDDAKDRTKNSVLKLVFSIDDVVRKAVRYAQEFIYKHIIGRTNRQYFDSELISASLGSGEGLKERVED
ncbi:MAG: DUF5828 family protein, partial [Candidatus Aenigmatarchaeota archaeon]